MAKKGSGWPRRSITHSTASVSTTVSAICTSAKGTFTAAISLLERALELCSGSEHSGLGSHHRLSLGDGLCPVWAGDEALALLERAGQQGTIRLTGHHFIRVFPDSARRICWLAAGKTQCRSPWRALDLSRTHQERGSEAWTLWLLGEMRCTA